MYNTISKELKMKKNIIKNVCSELNITQRELSEKIGSAEATIRNWSAGKEVPKWALKSMDLLIENKKNKEIVDALTKLLDLAKR